MRKLSPSTRYVLEALLPYTDANLKLAFKPSAFFYELSKRSKLKNEAYKSAFYRAIKQGLVVVDEFGAPRLTEKGRQGMELYKPLRLGRDAHLIVIFDIAESDRGKRDHLRALLRELSFVKVQQSVWASRYDHRNLLQAEIAELNLQENVIVYEAVKLKV